MQRMGLTASGIVLAGGVSRRLGRDKAVESVGGKLLIDRVMDKFRAGKLPVLIATNVAARGLDIKGIGRVINFDVPDSPELFTHRTGRTGRMGRPGQSITFLTQDDIKQWKVIERFIGKTFPRKRWTKAS